MKEGDAASFCDLTRSADIDRLANEILGAHVIGRPDLATS
jgi:hypothetical protein